MRIWGRNPILLYNFYFMDKYILWYDYLLWKTKNAFEKKEDAEKRGQEILWEFYWKKLRLLQSKNLLQQKHDSLLEKIENKEEQIEKIEQEMYKIKQSWILKIT